VPDALLYATLFKFVVQDQQFADSLAAAKKDDKPMRVKRQYDIGLTDAEFAQLKSIATTYDAQDKGFMAARTQLNSQIKASGQAPTTAQIAQGQALQTQIDSQRQSNLDQLKAALGPKSFKMVDDYVRKEVVPHVGYTQMKKQQGKK
jgi:hypothetical protein